MAPWTHHPKLHFDSYSHFCIARQRIPILYNDPPFSLSKLLLCMGIPSSNIWFLWPTQVYIPSAILIGSAILQGSQSWQTYRQTYRPRYSVCNNRLHLCSSAMRPHSNNQFATMWQDEMACSCFKKERECYSGRKLWYVCSEVMPWTMP